MVSLVVTFGQGLSFENQIIASFQGSHNSDLSFETHARCAAHTRLVAIHIYAPAPLEPTLRLHRAMAEDG